MENSLFNAISNISQSFYDGYVEANAKFRARSGIKTVIIRRELGKCCEWCAQLAGIYDYSDAPDDVFARHDNCKCMVTVKTEKGTYQDAWSKKEYKTQREARIARIDEIQNQGNKLDDLNRIKRIARDEGRVQADTTVYRLKNKYPGNDISDAKFYLNGKQKYYIDGHDVVLKRREEERSAAKTVVEKLGGTIQFLPQVLNPNYVKCADIAYNGLKFDIKTPKGDKGYSRNTISGNIKKAKGQANNVILNITDEFLSKGATLNNIINDVERAYHSPQIPWLDTVIVVYNDDVIKVYEKT